MEETHEKSYTLMDKSDLIAIQTELFGETACYSVYISKKTKEIIVDVTDYHCGKLHLSKSDLEEMLKKMPD